MADQNTTVAALPAGYATLAGVVYAITASSTKIWGHIAWARMSRVTFENGKMGNPLITPGAHADEAKKSRASIRYNFSSVVTKRIRQLDFDGSDGTAEVVAALHLLCSNTKIDVVHNQPRDEVRPPGKGDQNYGVSGSEASPTNTPLLNRDNSSPLGDLAFPDIIVKSVPHRGDSRNTVISLTSAMLRRNIKQIASVDYCAKSGFLSDEFLVSTLAYTKSDQFPKAVFIQAAAPYEAFMIEIIHKAVELVLACAIILGSSGGAWLGLTLGSMFPQRVAAGLFISSYGQRLSKKQVAEQKRLHAWRPAGTVWTEGPEPYLVPATGLSDVWRDTIGYALQYVMLMVVQYFKLSIRDALDFGPYNQTRDAIRYILLIIQCFALIVCGMNLGKKLKLSLYKPRTIISGTVYFIMLAAGLTCVILGQKSFLKPVWKFYLVSKIVDPIALVGSIAVMNLDWEGHSRLFAEKWILLWAIGACTVVW